MTVEFDKSFEKALDQIQNRSLFLKIEQWIDRMEKANALHDLPRIRKLTGYKNYYRIRIGDYRIGLEKINESTVRLIIVAHRKDIYNLFPK